MTYNLDAAEFLEKAGSICVIDVRAPKEFQQGHIPGAFNLPLFDDDERAMVGTLFKNSGREVSVLKGLEIAGPKLHGFIKQLKMLIPGKEVLVHCWRGGMRSESMAWLFSTAGYHVGLLDGGYKAYRKFIRNAISTPFHFVVLGGNTGSGKSEILKAMAEAGEQVLDLEAIANHKGSVYGGLGMPAQPTNEQFENDIYHHLGKFNPAKPIWVEDESRRIGSVSIPDPLHHQMSNALMIRIEVELNARINRIINEYSLFGAESLKEKTARLSEKLGGAELKIINNALDTGDFATVVRLVFSYYDKSYEHAVSRRMGNEIHKLPLLSADPAVNAMIILGYHDSLQPDQSMPYGTSLS